MKKLNNFLGMMLISICIGCSVPSSPSQGVVELKQAPSVSLTSPIWSPSGNELAASHISYSDHQSTLYIINLEKKQNTTLMTIDGEVIAHSWSPNGESVVVSILNSNKFSDGIWVFNITDNSNYFVGIGEAAAWSPDGMQLAVFSCNQLSDGNSTTATLRLVDMSTKKEEVLFNKGSCLKLAYVSWSSDNNNIAFSFSENKVDEKHLDKIFEVNLLTKNVNEILGEGNWSPSFSPNGERVIFVKNYGLAISNRTGTCQLDIKDVGIDIIGDVAWSPDGTTWAISGLGKIYLIDIKNFLGQDFYQNTTICP